MRKAKYLIVAFLFSTALICSGCVPLIVGGVGVLGGYAISKDTIQGEADRDFDVFWQAAKVVAAGKGTIVAEDKKQGYLELKVNSSRVVINITQLTKATVRLRVSARTKLKLPDIDLAQKIFIKILEE